MNFSSFFHHHHAVISIYPIGGSQRNAQKAVNLTMTRVYAGLTFELLYFLMRMRTRINVVSGYPGAPAELTRGRPSVTYRIAPNFRGA